MQEYGGGGSCKPGDHRDPDGPRDRNLDAPPGYQQYAVTQKAYGCSNKELSDQNATYCRVATTVIYEASSQQYQNSKYNSSAPTFSSPPNSPLVGLVFDPSSPNYSGAGIMGDRSLNPDRRSQSSWSVSNQEPIGTGAKKKIVKNQDKRYAFSTDSRHHDRFKEEAERQRKERNLRSESSSSLDFFAEGEKMVSELCNISDPNSRNDPNNHMNNPNNINQDEDRKKPVASSDILLTVLDKIVMHDQIPNEIVQLAIEACTDAENIAIAHHNRPCFKNIHSICAKTRSNVQKPDSAVANLHSQGIPWVIKNFIFSFVRILDGWKGVKELLSEKHDTFSRIENKYYSPNIRECFVQWQAVTKEMLTHIYKTFKCLDHGFTMEQKSFTHNYYATNSAGPRHHNQSKYQAPKPHVSTPRPVNVTPQPYNAVQPPWMQNQAQTSSQAYNDSPWPTRSGIPCKKFPVMPPPEPQSFYPLSDQSDLENYQKVQYKCDPCGVRETKPRQSWTITNVPDIRALEGMCHADQRELYNQLKHKMDAELGKAPGQPVLSSMPYDLLQRRDMELKAKMIPLSHVEKSLIPSMAAAEMRGYTQKNNSCGDTKEEADFFAAWGQMVQKEPNDFITHQAHSVPIPSNVVTLSNVSGPIQFIDADNDEFQEMSKVYMKPGSYKVPIKSAEPVTAFVETNQEAVIDNAIVADSCPVSAKEPFPAVTLAPQPKYNLDAWPCLISRRVDGHFGEEQKVMPRPVPGFDMRTANPFEILSAMTSDRAWEAAKQAAPKLMDFIHDSKSDAARLYEALGLSGAEELCDELNQIKLAIEQGRWPADMPPNYFFPKDQPSIWDQTKQHDLLSPTSNQTFVDNIAKIIESEPKTIVNDAAESKTEESEKRSVNFDQSGNYVRDDKKPARPKVTASGMWYQPKKKKPMPVAAVKKFESILNNLSQITEANFIQHDMDIQMAPRFYEVVKHPMCLHDIATKLKNSSYTESEQAVQDFRRIFNNVRVYLKSYPDQIMKKNVNKVSTDFEKMLAEEFPKVDQKPKDNADQDSKADSSDKTGDNKRTDKRDVK